MNELLMPQHPGLIIGGDLPIVVSEVLNGCLYSGFFGTLDPQRVRTATETILHHAEIRDIGYMIIDLSNVEIIDSEVAVHLINIAESLRLLGIEVVFCGMKPFIAQSITKAGISVSVSTFSKNLKTALKDVLKKMKLKIVSIEDK